MSKKTTRRVFLGQAASAALLGAARPSLAAQRTFSISLAAWSLHRTIGRGEGLKDMLEMPRMAKQDFGIDAIELVNQQMASNDPAYIGQLREAAEKEGVKLLLIMVDGAGSIGADSEAQRKDAVQQHKDWIDSAATLGCHSIRMNWAGGTSGIERDAAAVDALIARSAPGFRALCEYGDAKNINVLLENHWGPSSYPAYVKKLAETIAHPRFGTLPDFGNFPEDVDKYEAVDALMPYAKAVSAKCYDFDPDSGNETAIDFERMLQIVCDKHGYTGHIGIEFEGDRMKEAEGILAGKALLEKLRGTSQ